MSSRPVERLNNCPSVAVLRLMTHFARADEDYGIEKPLAQFNAGVPRDAVSRARSPIPRVSSATARSAAKSFVPGSCCTGRPPFATEPAASIGVRTGDDAALRDHRRCRRSSPARRSATAARTRPTRAGSHRRRGVRLRRRLSPATRPVRHAHASCREARRLLAGPGIDGHADRRPHRSAGCGRRQSRSRCGATACRSTTSPDSAQDRSATSFFARSRPRVPFIVSNVERLDFEI
jgi:hypothetical protein